MLSKFQLLAVYKKQKQNFFSCNTRFKLLLHLPKKNYFKYAIFIWSHYWDINLWNNTVSLVSELLFYIVLTAALINIYRVLKNKHKNAKLETNALQGPPLYNVSVNPQKLNFCNSNGFRDNFLFLEKAFKFCKFCISAIFVVSATV